MEEFNYVSNRIQIGSSNNMASKSPLQFKVCSADTIDTNIYKDTDGKTPLSSSTYARAGVLTLPHGEVRTPVFMPVGTKVCKFLFHSFVSYLSCQYHSF